MGKYPLGQRAFQKVWYLKLNDPESHRALWLRFTAHSSDNGFSQNAEIWAIFFERDKSQDVSKIAVKNTFGIESFSENPSDGLRIDQCSLHQNKTEGKIYSKGNSVEWNLSFIAGRQSSFQIIPKFLLGTKLVKNSIYTPYEELYFSGTTLINGKLIHWNQAPGMLGSFEGPNKGHSWVWGQCNSFVDSMGRPAQFLFEGLSVKTKLGPLVSPSLSSFYFYYKDQNYYFNTLRDFINIRSKSTLNEWRFRAERGDLSFRGVINAEYKDFAGLTFEDTNGSYLYCSNSKLAMMQIFIYRRGKLEATYSAPGTAGFEIVSRNKNPYVPLLI
jgi:hypothetical protein